MNQTLSNLVAATKASAFHTRLLLDCVERLERTSCTGLADKLCEYNLCGRKAGDLIAELQMALALAQATGASVELLRGFPDLRLRGSGLDCTIEIEHKSSVSAFDTVFHPDPDVIDAYRNEHVGWRAASWRLHDALKTLPFEVHPSLGADLSEPRWDGPARGKQEEACGHLAEWLVQEMTNLPQGEQRTVSHELASFDLNPLAAPPGWISGEVLAAVELNDEALSEWLGGAILRKSRITAANPLRRGKQHLVGLAIDEPVTSKGYALASTVLGGLVAESRTEGMRHYRGVPVAARHLLDDADTRGRAELLNLMAFDRKKPSVGAEGLVFNEVVHQHVDGLVALYHSNVLQFIPNPFSRLGIDPLCALFREVLVPFEFSQS